MDLDIWCRHASLSTVIEDKRAQISRNWAKFKGGTRAETSRTRSGTKPIVAFHIHQSTRSPRLTTERHSATLTCILAPDEWICREASALPLTAQINAEAHKAYVSSLLLRWSVFRDFTARDLLRRKPPKPTSHPSTCGTPGKPLSGPVERSELEFLCASRNPFGHS